MSHVASWLRTRRFSEPTSRPSGASNQWKNTVFRDFPTFSCICICFLLTLSLLWSSLFYSLSSLCLFPALLFFVVFDFWYLNIAFYDIYVNLYFHFIFNILYLIMFCFFYFFLKCFIILFYIRLFFYIFYILFYYNISLFFDIILFIFQLFIILFCLMMYYIIICSFF